VNRKLTIVSVAYPFAPVGPDAAGGAEQVLTAIDEALTVEGHRSVVIASEGSTCAGELRTIPRVGGLIDDDIRRRTHPLLKNAIDRTVLEVGADLVHVHGMDFHAYLPAYDVPVLATLHLSLSQYPKEALAPVRARTWLNGVSASQMRETPPEMPRVAPVPNGVRLDRFQPSTGSPRRYAIAIGRICPEKGFDLAIDAARRAHVPIILAGRTFAYLSHQRYFCECIVPRLGAACRFVGAVGCARKRALLSRARCLLVPSRAPETSSLVAMEALACGTPVVAMRVGALPDIVEHGKTGIIVDDVDSMARAIDAVGAIDRRACRQAAERRFGSDTMTRRYVELYERLIGSGGERAAEC
jgi:glycosyltransferase involved in cell wall biosynthesis